MRSVLPAAITMFGLSSTAGFAAGPAQVYDASHALVGIVVSPSTPPSYYPAAYAAQPVVVLATIAGQQYFLEVDPRGVVANAALYYEGANCAGNPFEAYSATQFIPTAFADIGNNIWAPQPGYLSGGGAAMAIRAASYAEATGTCTNLPTLSEVSVVPAQKIWTANYAAPLVITTTGSPP